VRTADQLHALVEQLQNLLVAEATGGHAEDGDYQDLRRELLSQPELKSLLPSFIDDCRSVFQFWEFIKHKLPTYAERRRFIWGEFGPLLDRLERGQSPSDGSVSDALVNFSPDTVHGLWSRALARKEDDPEGAITLARTLLETVCKHILDEQSIDCASKADLPKLYRLTAGSLSLAPSQHSEDAFKRILGGCVSVIEGLGTLRNKLGDSHGTGRLPARPAARHAELAVNLAGAMATFLVATWTARTTN